MINILYVDNFAEIIGGGQRSLLDLVRKLDKTKFNPMVICPSEGSLVKEFRKLNVDVRIVEMKSLRRLNLISFCKSISQLKKIIKDERMDLVHANGSRAAVYAGIAAKILKIPLIWHVRIMDSDGLLDRFLAGISNNIIAVSHAVNRRFSWMKNRESKVKTIYNGIDLKEFNPSLDRQDIRIEFGLKPDAFLVGTVGRLDWYKGYPYLLKAARKVVDNISQCHFLIVGDGEKRKELEDLINKLNLNDNVIFAGRRNDIPEILASLDLFVLSSVSEGLGRSIIEAMAMQKAVVATNVGGIPEVVNHNVSGILVPAKNIDALAEAIIDLIKNKDKAFKMGIVGREIAEAKFNLSFNIEKTQNLYLKLLKSERKDRRA
jgi:glycosyltransferase involved in cell wall biosynthesis